MSRQLSSFSLASSLVLALACNRPPPVPTVTLGPVDANTTTDLVADVVMGDDEDGDDVSLTYVWAVDGVERTDLAGATIPATETAKGEQWSVYVIANDGREAVTSPPSSLVIGNAPATASVVIAPSAPQSSVDLVATASGTDPDGDTLTFSYGWTRNGETTAIVGPVVPAAETRRDDVWEVTATPNDGTDDGTPGTASVTVTNNAPIISAISFLPDPADVSDLLVATVDLIDPDKDDITLVYEWEVNGTSVAVGSDPSLDLSPFERGDVVILRVTATDGIEDATPFFSDPLTIANALPAIDSVSLSPDPAYEDDTLLCQPNGWQDADGDLESYVFNWNVGGVAINDAGPVLTGVDFDKDTLVRCTAIPDDGFGQGESGLSNEIAILNTVPSIAEATIVPENPVAADTLSVDATILEPDPADTAVVTYEWFVDDDPVSTDTTLDPQFFSRGSEVRVTLTVSDSEASAPPLELPAISIMNAAPVIEDLTLEPIPLTQAGDAVAVATISDADGDDITVNYTWTVDGTEVGSSANNTLPPALFSRGQTVEVTVIAADSVGDLSAPAAASTLVVNDVPSITAVELSPSDINETTTVTCTPIGWADGDGDPETYIYEWTVNGTPLSTNAALNGNAFDKGDTVQCSATPTDGLATGTTLFSPAVIVGNSPPTVETVVLNTYTPQQGDLLVANALNLEDPDNDPASVTIEWYVEGLLVGTGNTLDSTTWVKGQQIIALAIPSDAEDQGTPVESLPATGLNTPPSISFASILPAPPTTVDDLALDIDAIDPDNDALTFETTWRVNGNIVSVTSEGTLASSEFERGDTVSAQITPSDDETAGTTYATSAVVIANSPPPAPQVQVNPTWATPGLADLVCAVVNPSVDADDDTVTYSMAWTLNGAPYNASGAGAPTSSFWPGDTIPKEALVTGQQWMCTATPADLVEFGAPATAMATVLDLAVTDLASGEGFTCGLNPDATLRCWGDNDGLRSTPPAGTFTNVSANLGTACAVDTANSLQCWGDDFYGQATPPSVGTWQKVETGLFDSCALGQAGGVACWGLGFLQNVPSLSWDDITVGAFHACVINAAGVVSCWGDNSSAEASPPAGPFRTVDAGWNTTCGIKLDGSIVCWGDDTNGVISLAPTDGEFATIDVGPANACATRTDASGVCWGLNAAGEADLPPASGWVTFAVGLTHTCGIDDTGAVQCWGDNTYGEATPPFGQALSVDTHGDLTCFVRADGELSCFGDNTFGQATPPSTNGSAVAVTAGGDHACARDTNGNLVCWGANDANQSSPAPGVSYINASAGLGATCAQDTTGQLECFGDNTFGVITAAPTQPVATYEISATHGCAVIGGTLNCWGDNSQNQGAAPAGADFVNVATGDYHSCATTNTGEVACWGIDTYGKVDDAPLGTGYVGLGLGLTHSCALTTTQDVECWGQSVNGRTTPPAETFVSIAGGNGYSCGLTTDNEVRCWGDIAR